MLSQGNTCCDSMTDTVHINKSMKLQSVAQLLDMHSDFDVLLGLHDKLSRQSNRPRQTLCRQKGCQVMRMLSVKTARKGKAAHACEITS